MAEEPRYSDNSQESLEGIDLKKLRITIRNNWILILLILVLTNLGSYLVIRYTKDLYQSVSELKLDVKQDAADLGLGSLVQDRQKMNLLSGEIETIRSKSFLSHVIDSLGLDVGYYSIGQFLNTELYGTSPFTVSYEIHNPSYYNTPFTFIPPNGADNSFELRFGKQSLRGTYNDTLRVDGLKLFIKEGPGSEFSPENTYSFIIHSRDVLLNYLASNLTVEPLKFEANIIRISFQDNNPFKARDLVNGIDSLYLVFSLEQKNRVNNQKIGWLNTELKNIETKMESYETYFEDFILNNRTSNFDADLSKTITLIHAIDSQRFEVNRKITEADRVLESISKQEFVFVQRSVFPDYINTNIEKVQELFLQMDKMKLSYSETTFAYRQKQHEIDNLVEKTVNQLTTLKTDWYKQLQQLNNSKTKLENNFAGMPQTRTEFSKNQRFYNLYEGFYLTLLQNRAQFEIAQAGNTPDFKILATANLPTMPISPNRPLVFGIGVVAGIVLNIFLIGILYLANNKINSFQEIERLSRVPVLGVVPASQHSNGSGLYVIDHPRSMVSEAIRTLRTNLDFFRTDIPQKVIAISSTVSGEGKSFIAKNLGSILALSRKKVILLDLDLRKKKHDAHFSAADDSKGISTVLIRKNGWEECLLKSPIDHFDYLPSGPQPPNPSELLMNGEFARLIDELKKHYDYILFDTPPVGLVTDGIMAMKQADVTIYVFRANYSKKDFVNTLNRIIRINKFPHITTLLNALPSNKETSYGYGYYEEEKKSWTQSILKRGA